MPDLTTCVCGHTRQDHRWGANPNLHGTCPISGCDCDEYSAHAEVTIAADTSRFEEAIRRSAQAAHPPPPRTLTALHIARQAWRDARAKGDTDRAEVARRRIDTLLDQLTAQKETP